MQAIPPILKATADLGISQGQIAKMLERSPGQVNNWFRLRRPIPPRDHVAMMFILVKLYRKMKDGPVDPDPKRERWRQATLASIDRWLDLSEQDLKAYRTEDRMLGHQLGERLWEKWRQENEAS